MSLASRIRLHPFGGVLSFGALTVDKSYILSMQNHQLWWAYSKAVWYSFHLLVLTLTRHQNLPGNIISAFHPVASVKDVL